VLVHKSGIPQDRILNGSIEVQISGDNTGDFWVWGDPAFRGANMSNRSQRSRFLKLPGGGPKTRGEWNHLEVTCKDDVVVVKLNGELVNHGTNCSTPNGEICLVSENGEIHFREILLQPLE
jgi:hypothetical protein